MPTRDYVQKQLLAGVIRRQIKKITLHLQGKQILLVFFSRMGCDHTEHFDKAVYSFVIYSCVGVIRFSLLAN